ncbi:MAG: CRISPR-associated protein Cas5 [Chitinophagales bacterium]|jgi:CRISPR-associated protein Cas5 subtype I-B|nr:CRISPR-associated protein Cas5 [Chitinophagales bacterium]
MKALQLEVKGNWGHFRKAETNNNPLSHDFITKTALIGMIGAVLGIEREEMKSHFPILCDDLKYGVRIMNTVQKQSWGFTLRSVNNLFEKSPKQMEFIRNPHYIVTIGLENTRSGVIFDKFCKAIINSEACYTPILGIHNCPAELRFVQTGELIEQSGEFDTQGFISSKHKPSFKTGFRLGFDKIPTFQNDDFWNIPDKYEQVIYPSNDEKIIATGSYYILNNSSKWVLI